MTKSINVTGSWNVQVSQRLSKKKITYNVEATLSQVGDQVIGILHYDLSKIKYKFTSDLKKSKHLTMDLSGGIHDGLLHLDYHNYTLEFDQFGTFILQIRSNKKMTGRFIGYGPESGRIIFGKLSFSR